MMETILVLTDSEFAIVLCILAIAIFQAIAYYAMDDDHNTDPDYNEWF